MKIILNLLTIICTLFIASCEKFLDKEPDMRVELDSEKKLQELLVSAYPKRNYLTFAEVASDNVEDKGQKNAMHNNSPFPELYSWSDFDLDDRDTPTDFWNSTYAAISASNHVLRAIEEGDFGAEVNQYKGEALIARAYNHFMLTIFFAKPYAKEDKISLGIPYVTEPNVTAFGEYSRPTLNSNYENIENDLLEGLKLINGGKWSVPKYHFTPAAANAFAARFYLFKKEWEKVIQHVNAIFPSGDFRSNLRQINSDMTDYTFAQYKQEYNKADKAYNLLLTETNSVYQRSSGIGGSRYGMGEKIVALHNGNTVYGSSFRSNNLVVVLRQAPNYIMNKFYEYFHYTNAVAGIGYPYIMQALFTVDEALMNRAEAYAQKENFDLVAKDMNDFASVRITNYNPVTHGFTLAKARAFTKIENDDKQAVLNAILDVRQKAFMQEGIRWMDIIRHELPVVHNRISESGLETTEILQKGDLRRVFQIPLQARNQGLTANER